MLRTGLHGVRHHRESVAVINTDVARLHALRQQVRTATLMRAQAALLLQDEPSLVPLSAVLGSDQTDLRDGYLFLRLWLATLYVAVEGWEALGCSDERVDVGLKNLRLDGSLDALRRFRNFVFHWHRETDDDRAVELLLVRASGSLMYELGKVNDALASSLSTELALA